MAGSLSEKQKAALEFIRKNVLHKYGSTGVQKCLNSMVFDVLNLIVVYPVANITHLSDQPGNVLPDAHLVPKGTTLKELAFRIHSDIGENFIGGLDLERKSERSTAQGRGCGGDIGEKVVHFLFTRLRLL